MAKKKKSVLSRQRPRKNRKTGGLFAGKLRFFLLISILAGILTGTVFYLKSTKTTTIAGQKQNWSLTIKSDDRSLLEGQEENSIVQAIKSQVTTGEKSELLKAVASIKSNEQFAKVHLVRNGYDKLTLYYSKRIPVMCYQGENLHLISTEADIYGTLESIDKCPGPVVTGILDDRKKYPKEGVLRLTSEERKNTLTALQLVKILRYHKHQPSRLSYEKYRGFYINLHGMDTDIALGNPPFETKLEKLGEVLEKIKNKGETAQRIELDFQGKAFIKLKKM